MTKYSNIPVKNIYYMLAYAFRDLHRERMADCDAEQFGHIHDFFAEILAKEIGVLLKRGLHREYRVCQEDLPGMRGKINLNETIGKYASRKKVLTCEFDEFSEDNIFNQILKTTVSLLLRHGEVKPERKAKLKKEMLFFSGIREIDPQTARSCPLRFERNNLVYQFPIGICRFVLNGLLPTTEQGAFKPASFLADDSMHRLYEKFILEYYRKEHPELHAAAEQIRWNLAEGDSWENLPVMRTDVTLSKGGKVLIIDAKFYSESMQTYYDRHSIHPQNLYQIFTYVKNKDMALRGNPHEVAGMLLYAKTDDEYQPDNSYNMSGNRIQVTTLDLSADFSGISARLDSIAESFFGA